MRAKFASFPVLLTLGSEPEESGLATPGLGGARADWWWERRSDTEFHRACGLICG